MKTYVISAELARTLWGALQYYGNLCTYQGERTGGVLKGCPRGEAPGPRELVRVALETFRDFESEIRAQQKPSNTEQRNALIRRDAHVQDNRFAAEPEAPTCFGGMGEQACGGID